MATTTTSTGTTSAPEPPPLRRTSGFAGRGTDSIIGVLVKVIGLGAVAGLVLYLTPVLLAGEKYTGLVLVWLAALGLFAVYATRRLVPLKYLLPGTLFLLAMIVYPIIATFGISFTNFGDGKRLSKNEAIASIVGSSVTQAPDSTLYNLTVGTTGSVTEGPFTFFLVQPESGTVYEGTPEDGLTELDGATVGGGLRHRRRRLHAADAEAGERRRHRGQRSGRTHRRRRHPVAGRPVGVRGRHQPGLRRDVRHDHERRDGRDVLDRQGRRQRLLRRRGRQARLLPVLEAERRDRELRARRHQRPDRHRLPADLRCGRWRSRSSTWA